MRVIFESIINQNENCFVNDDDDDDDINNLDLCTGLFASPKVRNLTVRNFKVRNQKVHNYGT